jgi:hypothetical protein
MNLTVKSAVVAALAVGACGAASAVDISTVAAGNLLYASGSTAIDTALQDYFVNSGLNAAICTAGTIDVYASTKTPKFIAVACTANAATTGLAAGTNIAIIKEDNAGSLNGIQGVQGITFAGSPFTTGGLQFPTVSQLANSATYCTTSAKTGTGINPYTSHTCGTATTIVQKIPALGFADVEAALFTVSATAPVALTATQTVIVPFAPAVSLGLYHALQKAQGLTVGSELIGDMPSLPRSLLHGIYTGQVNSWANVQAGTGAAVGSQAVPFGILRNDVASGTTAGTVWNGTTTATGLTTAPTATAANSTIYLCRRGNTSGTEKVTEWFYDDTGCASVAPYGFLAASSTVTTTLCSTVSTDGCSWTTAIAAVNPVVFPGNGTGDLLDCLVGNDQAGHFAIGFASIDNGAGDNQSNTARRNFRYIRIDGTAPSIENTAAGKWDYFAQSFAYAAPATVTWAATGNALSLLTAITKGAGTSPAFIGSPAGVSAVNASKKWYTDSSKTTLLFDGGVLTIPGTTNGTAVAAPNPASATVATFTGNPVSAVFKAKAGAVNNCLRPNVYSTTTTVGAPAGYATP